MIIAVVDTSTLASGALARDTPPAWIIELWRADRFQLVVSPWILDELTRALQTRYFRRRLDDSTIDEYLRLFHSSAISIEISASVQGIATHPEDDRILATAVSAHADYLVTSDTKLRSLGVYEGVRILSPRSFADLFRVRQPGEQDRSS